MLKTILEKSSLSESRRVADRSLSASASPVYVTYRACATGRGTRVEGLDELHTHRVPPFHVAIGANLKIERTSEVIVETVRIDPEEGYSNRHGRI